MKIIYFLIAFCFTLNSFSQGTLQTSIENSCDCEVLIFTEPILDPSLPPELTVGQDGNVVGDLDEFEKYIDGKCYRTVHVEKRKIINKEIIYKSVTIVNDLNSLLILNDQYTTFCFKGMFQFNNTINVTHDKILKLLGNSQLRYQGSSTTPAISFDESDSGIEGGEILTTKPMNEGLIRIISDRATNATSIQIKDTKLTSISAETSSDARDDRAINMTNRFESMVNQRDRSTNYFAKITNVDISGFAVGMHLRGWSNGVSVNDIRLSEIDSFGIWVSGCVDNSFANISFDNSQTASAIRIDNYVDQRFNGGQIGGLSIMLEDPNDRFEILTHEVISELLASSNNQSDFNINLQGLNNPNNDDAEPTFFFSLLEACGTSSKLEDNPFISVIDGNDNMSKFGLLGFEDDLTMNLTNYNNDSLDVTQVSNLFIDDDTSDNISLYKTNFIHNVDSIAVSLDEAACRRSAGFAQFFRRPSFNSFSQININDNIGISQVASLVEVIGREDGLPLCKERNDPNVDCTPCLYQQTDKEGNISLRNAIGFSNSVNICSLPDLNNPANDNFSLLNDNTSCPLEDVIQITVQN